MIQLIEHKYNISFRPAMYGSKPEINAHAFFSFDRSTLPVAVIQILFMYSSKHCDSYKNLISQRHTMKWWKATEVGYEQQWKQNYAWNFVFFSWEYSKWIDLKRKRNVSISKTYFSCVIRSGKKNNKLKVDLLWTQRVARITQNVRKSKSIV